MRTFNVALLVAAIAVFSSSGLAGAAPKDYCADLKGGNTGRTCEIQLADAGYNVNISIPLDYPDQKSVADYIAQTRDGFLNVAKSGAPRDVPYELDITPTNYVSAIPPRGTQAVVFKVYENIGAAHPQTMYKAFNWDQSYRKPIVWDTAGDDKKTPLWRIDDPLKTVAPIVQAELQKQTAPPAAIAPTALYDPNNYQDFAVTNDGVIFFFSQGQLLPEAAGAAQVLVPRAAIDPMLA
ncbi:MAG: esterase [Mycobacterium sp.]|uniref:esterase n=1 Tax=Mycobacterium sp. TaxID=1785 RepID=UPI0038997FFB